MGTVYLASYMGLTVLMWFLVIALTTVCDAHVSGEARFECGPHGKFEYCIDEVPGCVIGCHCHPGFYFDTDSKICEPNVKLSQQFRQHYLAESTPTTTVYPIPTATVHFDDTTHEIPKDTDELGDWLYNQFFKTIESQVINNSNNTKPSNENRPTRRSGDGPIKKTSQRKTSIKRRKKRKHKKKRGIRRKLLRITEDDSLFDSSSDSDYSEVSSSYSDSDSDDSIEVDTSGKKSSETEGSDDKDCDHGHKKVVIFNRRPKPPLPSFIFLPNMDTSFYPPIGLPPPPLVPMYPMVPVPPMAPPMLPPFPGPPKCDETSGKSTTTAADPHTTTTETTTESNAETTTETTTVTTPDPGPERRSRPQKHHENPNLEKNNLRVSKPRKQKKLKYKQQNKLMQKLREKLKGIRREGLATTHFESEQEEFQDEVLQSSDDVPNILEDFTPHKRSHQLDEEENHIHKLKDVDFKYLSELIHRVNQSKSRNRPHIPSALSDDLKELQKLQLAQPTRRHFGSYTPMPQVERQSTDDSYYSNLGRQIASMIRNADSKVDHQLPKEHANSNVPFHPVLNDYSSPHSFWERSVRSPVFQKGTLFEYLDESRTLKHSNEKSLVNLEDEVQIFASTPAPLSLQDLENILNTMQKVHAQIKFRQPMMNTKQSNVSLNVNLLQKHVKPNSTYSRLFDAPVKGEYITEHYQTQLRPRVYVEMQPAVVANASVFHEPGRKYNIPYNDVWMYNPKLIQSNTRARSVFSQTSKPITSVKQIDNTNPERQPFVGVLRPKNTETKQSREEYLKFIKSIPVTKHTTPKTRRLKIDKNKSFNYFISNMFEAAAHPIPAPFKTHVNKIIRSPPSYFHQQHKSEYFN